MERSEGFPLRVHLILVFYYDFNLDPGIFLFYFVGGGWWMVNGGLFSSFNFIMLIWYIIQRYNNYADQIFCGSYSEEIGELTPQ